MKFNKINRAAIIALICVVYILLRLWNVTDSCLGFDEIFSVHAAAHDWKNTFWFVAQDLIHPPLFYIFLKIRIFINTDAPLIILITLPMTAFGIIAFRFYFADRESLSEIEKRSFYLLTIFFLTLIARAFFVS